MGQWYLLALPALKMAEEVIQHSSVQLDGCFPDDAYGVPLILHPTGMAVAITAPSVPGVELLLPTYIQCCRPGS